MTRGTEAFNFSDLLFGEYMSFIRLASGKSSRMVQVSIGMAKIIGARHPFEIVRLIIGRIAVLVINLMRHGWAGANKGFSDNVVQELYLPTVSASTIQANSHVSVRLDMRKQDAPNGAAACFLATPYSAEIADFVSTIIVDYLAPFFHASLLV